MSDSKEDKPVLGRKPLGIKRTVESGQVQQQFSHGRKNTVVVEVKRRRVLGKPGETAGAAPATAPQPDPTPAQRPAAPAPQQRAPQPAAPARPAAPQSLMSRQELQAKLLREAEEARMAALEDVRRREDAARQAASEEEKRRAEENRLAAEADVAPAPAAPEATPAPAVVEEPAAPAADETPEEAAAREERQALGVEDALADMPHLTEAMLVTLGKAVIKTLDDLADLATDELVQKKRVDQRRRKNDSGSEDKGGILASYGLSDEQGNEIIMAARAHWFEEEA